MLYDLGPWDELIEVADGVTRYEEQHGPAQPGGMARPYAVLVQTWRGALDDDMTAAREALTRARPIEDPQVTAPAMVITALAHLRHGDAESALELVREYWDITRGRPFFRAQNLSDAVRIACAAGDIELAERLLDNVVTAAERDRLSALTARATIAQTGGEDATRLFEEAAEGWGAFGCRLEHALALRGAGQETEAAAILGELGVVATPVQTAARTAK